MWKTYTRTCAAVVICAGAFAAYPQAQDEIPIEMVPATFTMVPSNTGLPTEGRWKSSPVLVDVNEDGLVDLVSHPRLGKKTGVWLGDGKGNWTDSTEGLQLKNNTTCGGGVAPVDINKDGHLDLAVADHCDGVYIFFGDGKGKWQAATDKPLNPAEAEKHVEDGENPWLGSEELAVGDVNEDGNVDLVVAGSDRGGFTIYLGDGTGTKWQETPPSGLPNTEQPGEGMDDMGGWSREVLLVDMNNDKHLDVVASYHRGPRVYLGDGKAKFKPASTGLPAPVMYGIFQQIAVADLNRDKRLDILVANTVNGPEIYLQNANGTWKGTADVMPAMFGGAMSVNAGDLDGDGIPEIIVGGRLKRNGFYGVYVLRNDGKKPNWQPLQTELPQENMQVVWGVGAGDVNGDKRVDVIVTAGGSMGGGGAAPPVGPDGKPIDGEPKQYPNIQVWLNQPKN